MIFKNRQKRALSQELRDWIRASLLHREALPGPVLVDRLPGRRIAVLAPHPDDDVIGCGGTIHKHCKAGDHVAVVYLTDGARGGDWSGPPSGELAVLRRKEAEEAAGVLGVKDLAFLGQPDGELASGPEVVSALLDQLERIEADCILLPSFLDSHPDHAATSAVFADAAPGLKKDMPVWAYEVWSPLTPNRVVDITPFREVNELAIRKHASQMEQVDYAETAIGLNRFRSMSVSAGRGYCEAFFSTDARQYAGLVKRVLGA